MDDFIQLFQGLQEFLVRNFIIPVHPNRTVIGHHHPLNIIPLEVIEVQRRERAPFLGVPRRGGERQRGQGRKVREADAHGCTRVRDRVRREPAGAFRMC